MVKSSISIRYTIPMRFSFSKRSQLFLLDYTIYHIYNKTKTIYMSEYVRVYQLNFKLDLISSKQYKHLPIKITISVHDEYARSVLLQKYFEWIKREFKEYIIITCCCFERNCSTVYFKPLKRIHTFAEETTSGIEL